MSSIFEIYKIGIGPSSSHTMAPMKAARAFLSELAHGRSLAPVAHVRVRLYGSLALTGKGHATDTAILLGLSGETPENVDIEEIPRIVDRIRREKRLLLNGQFPIAFNEDADLNFDFDENPYDFSSSMVFSAHDAESRLLLSRAYLSLGGGAICAVDDDGSRVEESPDDTIQVPFPFDSADDLLRMGREENLSIADIVLANERARYDLSEINRRLRQIWVTMSESIDHAVQRDGLLPGPLKFPRRAPGMYAALSRSPGVTESDPLVVLDWVNMFAIAVNEESASGGRVVTAPTNGSAGVIPAVARYFKHFVPNATEAGIYRLLITAAGIGLIYKKNASFAASEVGCQGEIGVACSMAAAGLTAAMGGTNEQVELAAECGMEHNLGLTCDPIGGYVQAPCIERNAMGAVKALDAARLALRSDGQHLISLDAVIKTMMETGRDMQSKYKDTGKGGLAVNVPLC